ncbi:guanine permease [Raphidocelis subcapitata]|uniref:Guanine permease n=1 Tax=Raphidocelis subcapitata TaxID=307507 RepID=A0A2V0PDG0_9CHLO|nr:guanine permease [Raphidocelis subcapitata]|eukprot:GBF95930.1 guanine permease [Raphidocelis subcapitata]
MVGSLLVGLGCNMPFGVSPGMGLNAYLVYSQVLGANVPLDAALAAVAASAALVALLAAIHALRVILAVVPDSIKLATVVGMGLLLTFIGLQSADIVVADPETMVTVGDLFALKPSIAIAGLALITALSYRNVRGGIMIGILLAALAYFAAAGGWPTRFVDIPHLRIGSFDWRGLFVDPTPAAWSAVLAYTLVMVFDIGGAMFGLGNLAGLVKDGAIPGATRCYLAAAAATALGAVTGTTPVIIAAESAVGIKEGGRTGLVAVTISACFGLSVFFAPFLQSIPQVATAPVLVLVGAMMMGESDQIDWRNMLVAVPAFLTIVVQPFTFSIANGIYAGLVMSCLVYLLTGTFFEVARDMWAGVRGGGDLDGSAPALEEPSDAAGADPEAAAEAAAGKDDGLAAPLLGGSAGGSESDLSALHPPAARASDAISITQRRGSREGGAAGSLPRSHPYERGSFGMLINTHGSHQAPPHLAGSHQAGAALGMFGSPGHHQQQDPFGGGGGGAPHTGER